MDVISSRILAYDVPECCAKMVPMAVTADNEHEMTTHGRTRLKSMRAVLVALAVTSCLVLVAGIGLFRFAAEVAGHDMPAAQPPVAEGIVVLTGGSERIAGAVDLLAMKRGRRLLITGVNLSTSRRDIRRMSGGNAELFRCCIDLGYSALNTAGNAVETGEWARDHGFTSLIVVTSSYHMPRSLVELGRALPSVELFPYPVTTERFDFAHWWTDRRTATLMAKEYAKYLLALVRIRIATSRLSGVEATVSANGGI